MICTRIGSTIIHAHTHHNIPDIDLPFGEPCCSSEIADIEIILDTEKINSNVSVSTPFFLQRGPLCASWENGKVIWHHPRLGALIDSDPISGKVHVSLSSENWRRINNVFHQLIFPGLLAPLAHRGFRVIHAGAIEHKGKGIIVSGPTGSGKTTTVLRLVEKGARLIADDIVIIKLNKNNECFAWGVHENPRVDEKSLLRFQEWKTGDSRNGNKSELLLEHSLWTRSSIVRDIILISDKDSPKKNMLISLLSLLYHSTSREEAVAMAKEMVDALNFLEVFSPEEAYRIALTL